MGRGWFEQIANIFFRAGYVEAWGRGAILMAKETEEAGLSAPIIEEYTGGIQVAFIKADNQKVGEKLTINQIKILELIGIDNSIFAKELSEKIGISTRKVEENIKNLKEFQRLERIGPDKGGGYWEINLKHFEGRDGL